MRRDRAHRDGGEDEIAHARLPRMRKPRVLITRGLDSAPRSLNTHNYKPY
jgi:hypothetical protein